MKRGRVIYIYISGCVDDEKNKFLNFFFNEKMCVLIQGRLLVGFIYPVMGNPMSFQGEFQSCGGGILSDCYLGSFFFFIIY